MGDETKRLTMNGETEEKFGHIPIAVDSALPFGMIEVRDGENVIGRFVLFMEDDQEVTGFG